MRRTFNSILKKLAVNGVTIIALLGCNNLGLSAEELQPTNLSQENEAPRNSESLVGNSIAVNLDWTNDFLLLDWRPRLFPQEETSIGLTLDVSVGTASLQPVQIGNGEEASRRFVSALAIDIGNSTSALEAAAFIRTANRIIAMQIPGQEFSVVAFSSELTQVGSLSNNSEVLLPELLSIQKSESSSFPIEAATNVGLALSQIPADRRSVFLMTDAQSCGPEQPLAPEYYADFYRSTRVVFFAALYADTEPSPDCIEALTLLTETTGGILFTIDETGKSQTQPQNALISFVAGGELGFDLAGLKSPPGNPDQIVDIQIGLNDDLISIFLEIEIDTMSWPNYLFLLFRDKVIEISLVAATFGLSFIGLYFYWKMREKRRPIGWLFPIDGAQWPMVLARKGIVLESAKTVEGDGKKTWLKPRKKRVRISATSGVLLNGLPIKSSFLHDGDMLEPAHGIRFRFREF